MLALSLTHFASQVLTLKVDLIYWPTWELRLQPETCTWKRVCLDNTQPADATAAAAAGVAAADSADAAAAAAALVPAPEAPEAAAADVAAPPQPAPAGEAGVVGDQPMTDVNESTGSADKSTSEGF